MEKNIRADFKKYRNSIESMYKNKFFFYVIVSLALMMIVGLVMLITPSNIKLIVGVLFLPITGFLVFKSIKGLVSFDSFIQRYEETWAQRIDGFDWKKTENLVYEEKDKFIFYQEDKLYSIQRKKARTLPSSIKGIYLIIGENQNLFDSEYPLLIAYCDTSEIKLFSDKNKQDFLKHWKRLKLVNRVIRPVGITVGIILLVLLIWFGFI